MGKYYVNMGWLWRRHCRIFRELLHFLRGARANMAISTAAGEKVASLFTARGQMSEDFQ